MFAFLLIVQSLVAISLIGVILMQRSEGGGLGVGGSSSGFMTARGAADFLTRSTAIQGDNILIKTDKHEALLARSSFTPANGKLLFGMTQAQLNAEVEKGLAAAEAAVAAGATVKGSDGAAVGTIDTASDESVTITLSSGKKVQLSRNSVRGNPDGTVVIGLTSAQLEAQVQAAESGSSSGK